MVNKLGRKPMKATEKKVSVGGYIELKHKPKAKKAIDRLLSDVDAMLAYAEGGVIIIEPVKKKN